MLQSSQDLARTYGLSQLHEQLDVERFGAVEEPVLDADLVQQLTHLGQGAVGRSDVPGRELDEAEGAEEDRRPPRLGTAERLLDERFEGRSRADEPPVVRIHERSPCEWKREPAAHLEALLDRLAALLDQPVGEVPAARVEFDEGEVREPFRTVRLGTVVTCPGQLALVARPRRVDVVGALEPDERNGVRVDAGSGLCLERDPTLHQVGTRGASQKQIEQAQVDQQRREHRRLSIGACVLGRSLSVLAGAGGVARCCQQDEPRRDPRTEARVVACCRERLFEIRHRLPDHSVVPLDLREQLETLRLQGEWHAVRLRILREQARTADVTRSKERGSLPEATTQAGVLVLARRQAAGGLEQLDSGIERSAQCSLIGGLLDLRRGVLVRLDRALRQVTRALLRVHHDFGKSSVQLSAARVGRRPVHRRRKQGMGEAHSIALGQQHPGCFGFENSLKRIALAR